MEYLNQKCSTKVVINLIFLYRSRKTIRILLVFRISEVFKLQKFIASIENGVIEKNLQVIS